MSSTTQNYVVPYLYAISSNIFFILGQFIAKLQTELVSPMFILYYRSLLMMLLNSFLINMQNKRINNQNQNKLQVGEIKNDQKICLSIRDPETFSNMIKRVLFACISIATFTMALKNSQLSITNALFQTGPIFVFFVEAIVHKMPLRKIHLLLTVVSFCGVIIILYPSLKSHQQSNLSQIQQKNKVSITVYLLPILSAITSACSMTYLYMLRGKCHTLVTVQYFTIGAALLSGLMFGFFVNDNNQSDSQINLKYNQNYENIQNQHKTNFFTSIFDIYFILSTIIMTLLIFLCQYFRTKSLSLLPASRIAPLHYFGIILSILFDIFVFNYNIQWYQFIGMLLAGSGLMTKLILQKYQKQSKG